MIEPNGKPKWKRFEALVARVQQVFSPEASVSVNEKIVGKRSGTKRQIDISVRRAVGQFTMHIVIECKDYRHPVDVKGVEEFIGLLEDVGANKGAMIAANGFTEAAKTRAKNSGIDLYRLVDAEAHDWQAYVTIPTVCDFRSIGDVQFRIDGSQMALNAFTGRDPRAIPVYDSANKSLGTPLTLLWAKWNRKQILSEIGQYSGLSLSEGPTFLHVANTQFEPINISANISVIQKLYYGQVPLTKFVGFRDEIDDRIIMPHNSRIETDYIDPTEVERTWLKVPSLDSLAIKPVIVLKATDRYPTFIPGDAKNNI